MTGSSPRFSDRAHRIAFRSRHSKSAVWPIHDLVYNDLLTWLLPTHRFTLVFKFFIVLITSALLAFMALQHVLPVWLQSLVLRPVLGGWTTFVVLWIWYYRRVLVKTVWERREWMDPTVIASSRMPMHCSTMRWYSNEGQARRGACVPQLQSMNGHAAAATTNTNRPTKDSDRPYTNNVWLLDDLPWMFCFQNTAEAGLAVVQKRDFDNDAAATTPAYEWNPIPVPSNWTLQGYDKPIYTNIKYPWPCQPPLVPHANPTGVYKVKFELPWKHDAGSTSTSTSSALLDSYSILFHGVESAFYVYWNKHFVGFSKDSRLPAEFDVTPYIRRDDRSDDDAGSSSAIQTLEVVVLRWSDGSYVEDQDQWWMAGIHRSVELIRRPMGADIVDYQVQADANGHLNCHVECTSSGKRHLQRRIVLRLYDDEQLSADGNEWKAGQLVWEASQEIVNSNEVEPTAVTLSGDVSNVRQWSAETPNLYTMTISLEAKADHGTTTVQGTDEYVVQQVESCRVGFRTVDIVNGMVHVNGKRITVCGMNRHEHNPDHGKVVSLDQMKQDICLLKQNNFNLVRTSHYPNHPSFYRFTDWYGLYVWDEGNFETHGMKPMGRLAHDFGWKQAIVSRVTRMVQRDRNHASIIFWSLGNEGGRGRNLTKAREIVQELDPSRPVVYESGGAVAEGTGRSELTDVISTMYPSVPRTLRLATRADEDRPVILCEYSHSMGNSNGNLHYYWQAFWDDQLPRLQGGCIWDFVDQALRLPDTKNGDGSYFAYGGDFGDTCNDAQFCCNGMFSPDREPHPVVAEVRFLQQPVLLTPHPPLPDGGDTISIDAKAQVTLQVTNRYSFRDLSHLSWSWQLASNISTEPIQSGSFDVSDESAVAVLQLAKAIPSVKELERTCANARISYLLNIRGMLHKATSWANVAHVLVSYQFPVHFELLDGETKQAPTPTIAQALAVLELEEDERHMTVVRCVNGKRSELATVDKTTGALISYAPHGHNILTDEMTPNFVRAATDNDRGGMELALNFMLIPSWVQELYYSMFGYQDCSYWSRWKAVGLDGATYPTADYVLYSSSKSAEMVEILVVSVFRSPRTKSDLYHVVVRYSVYRDGRVQVTNHVKPMRVLKRIASLPRIGMKLVLDPSLHHIQYYGRGPEENYPDRKASSEMGVYTTSPSTMAYTDYVFPVENGSRSDCEYVAFRSSNGEGVCLVSTSEPDPTLAKFSCSAQLHSITELHDALHTCDLERRSDGVHPVYVNVDHELMGLGADCSWYPVVYDEFLVKPTRAYAYSVWLLPLSAEDNPSIVARTLHRKEAPPRDENLCRTYEKAIDRTKHL